MCPPEIERAHELNDRIQSKVSCRDLADDEIADFKDDADNSNDGMSDVADDETTAPVHHTSQLVPRVRTTRKTSAAAPARQQSVKGSDLLDRIADSLNPQHQAQRDAERTSALFQSQQLILLQSQVRDLNQTVQTLRNQLDDSERRRVSAERRVDRLQNQIYITSLIRQTQPPQTAHPLYREPPVAAALAESSPSSQSLDQDRHFEATYRDGGRCSWFGNEHRLDSDDDIVEVSRIPWSPSPRSPAQNPPLSDSD